MTTPIRAAAQHPAFATAVDGDYLSEVPDPILGLVLSHLPLSQIASTKCTSKRFKNLSK